ncbi:uncharacterized protein LOC120079279 [Benincasa hispida]|uniref:uncharacterized protein LOC120079279 n=1 Tax=Benincasa hispida TaxID=102211 RepID=UPI00190017D1|nr:uncharacterized protein LOC120079279 [Benincasa hispida]
MVEENTRFKIKSVMLQMVQNTGQFGGLQGEDLHAHLTSFVEMCSTFSISGVTPEGIRLYLFPYTLRDEANIWAHSLEPNEITSWDQLVEWFMKKFFPPTVNARRRKDVLNFEQMNNETLSTTWVHLRRLVKNCLHIGIPDCVLMKTFYNGLNRSTQVVADASVARGFMDKTYTEAKVILHRISRNTDDCVDDGYGGRGSERRRNDNAIVPLDTMTTLAAQMAAVTSLLQTMALNQGALSQISAQPNAPAQVAAISCVQCGGGHANHPNFGWGGNHNQGGPSNHQSNNFENRGNSPPFHQNQNQGHQPQPQNLPSSSNTSANSSSLESLLKQYIEKNDVVMQSQVSSIRNLEIQVGQLATELRNRTPGTLPSNSEAPGSHGKEQCP